MAKRGNSVKGRRPFCDATKTPQLSPKERKILKRIDAGETLHIGREHREGDTVILNSFWWDHNDTECDCAVWMLMRRGLIMPTGVGGGAQWLIRCASATGKRGGVENKGDPMHEDEDFEE